MEVTSRGGREGKDKKKTRPKKKWVGVTLEGYEGIWSWNGELMMEGENRSSPNRVG